MGSQVGADRCATVAHPEHCWVRLRGRNVKQRGRRNQAACCDRRLRVVESAFQSGCSAPLWCRRRLPGTETILEVLPERTPEPWEAKQLVGSLIARNPHALVRMDLSQSQIVDSAFVARLISMNRSIRGAGGRFVLRGMCSTIREVFAQLRLDQAFEIVEDEQGVCDTHLTAAAGGLFSGQKSALEIHPWTQTPAG